MKITYYILSIIIILISFVSCQNPEELFKEKQDNWLTGGDATWSFDRGELVAKVNNGFGFVMTQKTYGDFILKLEFYPDSNINSGVFIRCKGHEISPFDCYEINIWDMHPKQEYRTGSIVTRSEPLARVETINDWNTIEIICEGGNIKAMVNGILTADIQDKSISEGHIALQAAESGKIIFRNVEIRAIK